MIFNADNAQSVEEVDFAIGDHNYKKARVGSTDKTSIPTDLFNRLNYLGLIPNDIRSGNVGQSDYATKTIQPWSIFLDNPQLTYPEADLIKRIIRHKESDSRLMDFQKCRHILDELIRVEELKEQ